MNLYDFEGQMRSVADIKRDWLPRFSAELIRKRVTAGVTTRAAFLALDASSTARLVAGSRRAAAVNRAQGTGPTVKKRVGA